MLDFGLARSVEIEGPRSPDAVTLAEGPTVAGTVLGTMGYMSPEQARGETATPASDVFALGCVLHEMLSGSRPFERKTDIETLAAVLSDAPPPLAEPSPGAFAGLDRVVAKTLAKDPRERYPAAGEMAAALDGVAERLSGRSRRMRLPAGAYRYRVRKDGYVTEQIGAPSEFVYLRLGGTPLHPEGSVPAGMVLVQGVRSALLTLDFLDRHLPPVRSSSPAPETD